MNPMKPSLALAAQLDLIEWVKRYGEAWGQWFGKTYSIPRVDWRPFFEILKRLNRAETVFVSAEMCALVEKAVEDMPDVPIQVENLMWKEAFIYFERPIRHPVGFVLGEDQISETRAIGFWDVAHLVQGETVDTDEPVMKPGVVHVTFVDSTEHITDTLGWSQAAPLFPYDLSGWTYGKRWESVEGAEGESGKTVFKGLAQQRKLLLAVNLLAAQYISVRSTEKGIRQQRRRGERMGLASPNPGDITYVTLRRAHNREASGEGEGVEFSHRFIVSGHWRHQFYPSRGEHRLIWINPFIKGPDDKPLIIRDRVYGLVR